MPIKNNNSNEKNQILKQIGQNIKQARISKNITQEQLAENLNTSVNFISLIERGQSGINIVNVVNICKTLQIQPNTLFNNIINIKNRNDSQLINSLSLLNEKETSILQNLTDYMLSTK